MHPALRNAACALGVLLLSAVSVLAQQSYPDAKQIVSIGGSVTEIIYALGEQDRLVARDTTSIYPAEVVALPDVGYMRRLSPEGILSVDPDLIIAEEGSGPLETIELLAQAEIAFVTIADEFTSQGILDKITAVAETLGVPEKGAALVSEVSAALKAAEAAARFSGDKKRVMFVLSARDGRFLVSGANTAADSIIRMAGGINAVSEFDGYKPITDEAISAARPDVILQMRRPNHQSSIDDLLANPAVSITPAAQNRDFIDMDGLLMLGFGPRTAQAIRELNNKMYQSKG